MAIVAHVVLSGLTEEDYDRVREAVGWPEAPPGWRVPAPDVVGRRPPRPARRRYPRPRPEPPPRPARRHFARVVPCGLY